MRLKHVCASIPVALALLLHSVAGGQICAGVTCGSPYPAYAEAVRHPNATGNFTFDGLSIGSRGAVRRAVRDIGPDDHDDHDRDDNDRDDNDPDDHDRDRDRDDHDDDDWTWHTRIMDVNVEADKNVLHQSFELYGQLHADHGDHDDDEDDDVPRNVCALLMPLRDWDREQKGRNEDGDCSTVFRDNEIRDMKRQLRSAVERGYESGGQTSPCGEVTELKFDIAGDIITTRNTTTNSSSLIAKYVFAESDSHQPNDTKPYATMLNQIRPIILLSYPASPPPENRRDDDDLIEMRLTCVWAKDVAEGSLQPPKPNERDDDDDDDRDDHDRDDQDRDDQDRDDHDRDDQDRDDPDDQDRGEGSDGQTPDGQSRGEDREGNEATRGLSGSDGMKWTMKMLIMGWGVAWHFF